ncbi:hypothetical protein BDW67DRAFT_50634 [Aspergillus spinulosporus]
MKDCSGSSDAPQSRGLGVEDYFRRPGEESGRRDNKLAKRDSMDPKHFISSSGSKGRGAEGDHMWPLTAVSFSSSTAGLCWWSEQGFILVTFLTFLATCNNGSCSQQERGHCHEQGQQQFQSEDLLSVGTSILRLKQSPGYKASVSPLKQPVQGST